MVPAIIFLTPKGEIADRINKGELPNPAVEDGRTRILEAFKSVAKRNELTELVAGQIKSDLVEASLESEIYETVNSHISALNYTLSDLKEFERILQKFSKKQNAFVV